MHSWVPMTAVEKEPRGRVWPEPGRLALVCAAKSVVKVATGRVLLPLRVCILLATSVPAPALRSSVPHVLASIPARGLRRRVTKGTVLAAKLTSW
jgi:hypothetical protein